MFFLQRFRQYHQLSGESNYENTAFNEYERKMTQYHHNMKLRKSGFYIGDPAYLGASPDGIIEDINGDLCGILEIKCPYPLQIFPSDKHVVLWMTFTATLMRTMKSNWM